MIEIYIKNFMWEGSFRSGETLLQKIPDAEGGPRLIDPRVKAEMGKAPTFEFSIPQNHPFYSALMQMKTILRIVYCGETLFRGRVLSFKYNMYGQNSVHCEGDFTFLMDTPQPGTKEETRPIISVSEYLEQVIAEHNRTYEITVNGQTAYAEPDKIFQLGEYPDHYSSSIEDDQKVFISREQNKQQFGNTSWNTAMDRIEDLLGDFGGYIRTRYDDTDPANPVVYLDWFDQYYRHNQGNKIVVAKNLIDLSASLEVENIFTVVIPIGKRKDEEIFVGNYWPRVNPNHPRVNYILVPELVSENLFTTAEMNRNHHKIEDYQEAINKYGYITKVVSFENADMEDVLFSYAKDWIRRNYMGKNVSYEVTAIDMVNLDPNQSPLFVGDSIVLQHPVVPSDIGELTVISAEYNLYELWKSKFKIGIPNELLNSSYGVKKKDNGKGSGGGGASNKKPPKETPEEHKERAFVNYSQQYSLKTDSRSAIKLDDFLAFLTYDDYGLKLSDEAARKKANEYNYWITMMQNDPRWKTDKWSLLEDPEYIDVATEYYRWKSQVQFHARESHDGKEGLTEAQASILTNEEWFNTWMAVMIDNEGNVKPEYANYTPEVLEMAKQAWICMKEIEPYVCDDRINNSTAAGGFWNSLFSNDANLGDGMLNILGNPQQLFGNLGDGSGGFQLLGFNITNPIEALKTKFGDYLSAEGLGENNVIKQLMTQAGINGDMTIDKIVETLDIDITGFGTQDIVNAIQTKLGLPEDITSTIKPITDLFGNIFAGNGININSPACQIKAGKGEGSNWNVVVNDRVTYKDDQGVQQELVPGFVSSQDLSIPSIPSLKTDLIVTKHLIAQQIDAAVARIQSLEAGSADIDKLINGTTLASNIRTTNFSATNPNLGTSNGGVVKIYGQTVRVYTVTDDGGTVRHVFGY